MYFVAYLENMGAGWQDGWISRTAIVDKHPLDWLVECIKLRTGSMDKVHIKISFWEKLPDDLGDNKIGEYRRAVGMKYNGDAE